MRCLWLIGLILLLVLLALNTLACSLNRLSRLIREIRRSRGLRMFIPFIPSFIHLLFLWVLLGHLLTFTFGRVLIIPLEEGRRVTWNRGNADFRVGKIETITFPSSSILKGQLKQIKTGLVSTEGNKRPVSFMHPLYHNGEFIFLDMRKMKRRQILDQEDCDQSQLFKQNKSSRVYPGKYS